MVVQIKKRVTLEPELEAEVGSMRPAQRRQLAKKLYRWSKQLWVSAAIIESDEQPRPKPVLKFICRQKAVRN